ncbi:fungal specific transcription factor [Apiospora phragmitis]|uniref:Fungal specific transcription factor n=1 Tax=Apiospora phragmitis TaxID=2905665 RepID=A0ABR1T7N9_9PEZI
MSPSAISTAHIHIHTKPARTRGYHDILSFDQHEAQSPFAHESITPSFTGLCQTQAATITSPLRIASILSPPDPESQNSGNTPSYHSTPKRRFEDAFVPPDAHLAPPTHLAPLEHRQHPAATERPQSEGLGGVVRGYVVNDGKGVLAGGYESKKQQAKMRPPMRSSIACLRCRKSKIKCENNGGSSPCDSCIKTGKECIFKLPEANPAPTKRTEPPVGMKQDRDGGSDRKKLKRIDDISKMDNQKATMYADEVLAAPFLTEDLWEQVLDLYKLHFAPELPFLHLPTMKDRIAHKFKTSQPDPSPDFNLVLLGVLTLTARFHPDLVKYLAHVCSSQSGNARSRPVQTQIDPAAASEYYADTLTMALGPLRTTMRVASVERVQALLMLGLYEWGQTRPQSGGLAAWMYVGSAIRMAQFLKLGFGDVKNSREGSEEPSPGISPSQRIQDKEVKRRTMFSCLILDRMLACGKERSSIMRAEDLQIQLPCPEDRFDLSVPVKTLLLRPRKFGEQRHIQDDSVLSRFIQLVDLWGDISKFSIAGGRLVEEYPPWDERTTFYQLREAFEAFDADLPDTFTFSRSNYFKHENHQASSVYVLLHMLRNVCLIMLHREYIPFVPIRCKKGPVGPLDKPTFPEDQAPELFWLKSAEYVFKAGREIIDLIEICQKKDKLPQSTIVLFAIWTAAFVAQYAKHFPHMDTEKHILSHRWNESAAGESEPDNFQHGPTGLTYQTLNKMTVWLKMASTYVGVLQQMDRYFSTIKRDFDRHVEKNKSLEGRSDIPLRQGGGGADLENYSRLDILKDFGVMRPGQIGRGVEGMERSRDSPVDRGSPIATENPGTSGSDRMFSRSAPSGSFTAINRAPMNASPMTHAEANGPMELKAEAGSGPPPNEGQEEHWQQHRYSASLHQMQSPPQVYASSGDILDPAAMAAQAMGYARPQYEIDHEESRRFNVTNDLGILTQNNDPWDGIDGFFSLSPDVSYQLMPQHGGFA